MTEFTTFLPPELADIGLVALVDPGLADRLVEALRALPAEAALKARQRPAELTERQVPLTSLVPT